MPAGEYRGTPSAVTRRITWPWLTDVERPSHCADETSTGLLLTWRRSSPSPRPTGSMAGATCERGERRHGLCPRLTGLPSPPWCTIRWGCHPHTAIIEQEGRSAKLGGFVQEASSPAGHRRQAPRSPHRPGHGWNGQKCRAGGAAIRAVLSVVDDEGCAGAAEIPGLAHAGPRMVLRRGGCSNSCCATGPATPGGPARRPGGWRRTADGGPAVAERSPSWLPPGGFPLVGERLRRELASFVAASGGRHQVRRSIGGWLADFAPTCSTTPKPWTASRLKHSILDDLAARGGGLRWDSIKAALRTPVIDSALRS